MLYIITFLEGIISFISPCILPMLPIYLSYFAGQEEASQKKTIINSIGFILGFTVIFVLLGVFAGSLGTFLKQYQTIVNVLFGIIIILFGLNYMEVIRLPQRKKQRKIEIKRFHFFSSFLFGIIFAVQWTPCIGTFLGSALLLASTAEHVLEGVLLLVCFSLGLGIPFFISSLLIEKLKVAFDYIKRHYGIIQKIAGIYLMLIGILMATGTLGAWINKGI